MNLVVSISQSSVQSHTQTGVSLGGIHSSCAVFGITFFVGLCSL